MATTEEVSLIITRANELAPNSNFKIVGFEAVKFRIVVQALLERIELSNAVVLELAKEKK